MKVEILGMSPQQPVRKQYVSSYLINARVAVDAGCLGFHNSPREQERIRHVFLTHSHSDHTGSLPIFVENAWTATKECPKIYGTPETLDSVQRHIFNDVMWPDFVALSKKTAPFLRLVAIENEVAIEADGLQITPIPMRHVVPTVGYVIREGRTAIIIAGDTGPTTRIWEVAHETPGLQAVFLEACFPRSMKRLAKASLHLTTEMFAEEVAKMPPGIRVIATHIKVRYRDEVVRELFDLGLPQVEIGECEREYDLSEALVAR